MLNPGLAGGAREDCTKDWVLQHYRLVVWKLACMERAFPSFFGGWYLTADRSAVSLACPVTFLLIHGKAKANNFKPRRDEGTLSPPIINNTKSTQTHRVLLQLQNRYEREFVACERSYLQQLLQKDQLSTRHIVLCVTSILPAATNSSVCEKEASLQLTDGWCEIGCRIDPAMSRLVVQGKIYVGQKLRIHGAGLASDVTPPQLHVKVLSCCAVFRAALSSSS